MPSNSLPDGFGQFCRSGWADVCQQDAELLVPDPTDNVIRSHGLLGCSGCLDERLIPHRARSGRLSSESRRRSRSTTNSSLARPRVVLSSGSIRVASFEPVTSYIWRCMDDDMCPLIGPEAVVGGAGNVTIPLDRVVFVMFATRAHQADGTISSKTSSLAGNVTNCTEPYIVCRYTHGPSDHVRQRDAPEHQERTAATLRRDEQKLSQAV